MADIDLSFGVSGGGAIDAGSGKAIKDALESIIREVTKESIKIRVEVDPSSITNFKTQLADLTSHAKMQAATIQAAYAGIQLPKVPTQNSGKGSARKHGLIKSDSDEMVQALAELKKYQAEVNKILRGSSAAKTGVGQQTYQELEQINYALKVYEELISKGSVHSDAFAADMKNVAATIRMAKSEFKMLGENLDNHIIEKNSTEMFDGLTEIQTFQKHIKQMQEEWTAASQNGAKSFNAMQNLAAQGTALDSLEAKLRAGQVGANDLAAALERAGAVINQTSAEIKLHGENKGLIDFGIGTKEHTKALEDVSRLLVKTKKDYEAWTAAAKGPTADSYSGLKDQISLLENLHKQLIEGKISWKDYEQSISRIKSHIAGFSGDIKAAGKNSKSLGDSVGGLVGKFTKWLGVSQLVMKTIQTVRQMVTTVTAIDTAMTELRKVTDATDTTYDKFLSNAVVRAKSLGATLTDVVTATADFAKLGYSIGDASDLADAAIVYKNVGDNIESIDTAAESIISTMQAFADENHSAMEIVDKFNSVGNQYAITSTGVGDALQRSAAAMNAAGNSLDETIALITAANTIVQNPESVGTTLKTVSMYLRAAKTEAEEAGESTDGMAGSMSELRQEILDLTGQKIDIQIDEDNFKSTFQILKELSGEWDNLTDVSQANLLELIGGKRNANVVSALLENFTIAEDALTTSMNSAGSALAENEKYLDSIQGKIQQFQASWQALSASILDTGLVKGVIDVARIFVDGITLMTDTIGGLSLAIGAVPLMSFVSKLKPVAEVIDAFKLTGKEIAGVFKLPGIQEAERALAAIKLMTGDQKNGIAGRSKTAAMAMTGANEATIKYIRSLDVASAAELSFGQCISLANMNLAANTKMLLANAAAWLKSPLGIATVAVTGLYLLAKGADYLNKSLDRSRDKLSELKSEYSANESELDSLKDEFDSTSDKIKELENLKATGDLSITGENELQQLRARNVELQRSIDLLKLEQDIKQDSINRQFIDAMREHMERDYIAPGSTADSTGAALDTTSKLDYYLDSYENYQKQLVNLEEKYLRESSEARENGDRDLVEKLEKNYEKQKSVIERNMADIQEYLIKKNDEFTEDMANISYTPDAEAGSDEAKINEMLSWIGDFQDRFSIAMGETDAVSNAFGRLITQEFAQATEGLIELGEAGEVTAEMLQGMLMLPGFDAFVSKCLQLGVISDTLLNGGLAQLAALFNGVGSAAVSSGEGLAGTSMTLEQINQKIDNTQTRISSLSDALKKLDDGSMSLGEVIDLIQEFPKLAGYVDLTSESFGNLDVGLRELISNEPSVLTDELMRFAETRELTDQQRESVYALIEAINSMSADAVRAVSSEYGILADRINDARGAQTALQRSLSEPDHDAGHKESSGAFDGFKQLFEDGKWGSKYFSEYEKYFGVAGKSVEELESWFKANEKLYAGGKKSAEEFLSIVEKMSGEGNPLDGIASYDSKTGKFWYDFFRTDEFADVIGTQETELQNFLGLVKMFYRDYQDFDIQEQGREFLDEGLLLETDNGTIAFLDKLMTYTKKSKEEVHGLINEFNIMKDPLLESASNESVDKLLKGLGEGGSVDLTVRPKVSGKTLSENGWDAAADEIATVFSETFSSEDGTVAMNFTPIMVDENGNYAGVMDPKAFGEYCQSVVDGAPDDLGLKIGATFEGDNAVNKAIVAADQIHRLHELLLRDEGQQGIQIFGEDQITVTQELADQISDLYPDMEDLEGVITSLNDAGLLNFASDDISFNGKTIKEILGEQVGLAEEDTVDINITMNIDGDDQVIAVVTTTVEAANNALKDINGVELKADDKASVSIDKVDKLVSNLDGSSALVTVLPGDQNETVIASLERLLFVLTGIAALSTLTIAINGGSGIRGFATGTKHAKRGPALLGDEYSPTGEPKPELVVSRSGAYIAGTSGPEMGYLDEGDVVYNADDTEEILRGNARPKVIQAFSGGTDSSLIKKPSGGFSGGGSSNTQSEDDLIPSSKAAFDELYDYHQHLIAMDQESMAEYLEWLDKAYKEAFEKGDISKEDYWKYQEEVYEELKELFNDYVDDTEHQINMVINNGGDNKQVVNMYQQLMKEIESEIAKAKENGLDENNEYVQELEDRLWDFQEEIKDIQEEIEENAKDAIDDLVDYRIDMLKQEIKDEKDALNDKLNNLKDFYKEQKDLLKEADDEEAYLKDQAEKRKAVSDIREEMSRLKYDDSAFAKKRMLELQEELNDAEEALNEFEKKRALEDATDFLDDLYEKQETQIKSQIDDLDDRLNDPEALYNKALHDIQNNTLALYEEMVSYNNKHGSGNPEDIYDKWTEADEALDKFLNLMGHAYKDIVLVDAHKPDGYASGTVSATRGVHEVDEYGPEYVFTSSDGRRYRAFTGGEKVLNATATNFLYKFATSGGQIISDLFNDISNKFSGINANNKQFSPSIALGNIIIQGNADQSTVSEIRREKREEMRWILQEFNKMNKRV